MDELTDPADLYRRVLHQEPGADLELYVGLVKKIRPMITGRLRTEDVEDVLHELYLVLWSHIQRDLIRDPGALWGYASCICKRMRIEFYERYREERHDAYRLDNPSQSHMMRSDKHWQAIERGSPSRHRELCGFRQERPSPEESAIASERKAQILEITRHLAHGEVIEKFYFGEQTGPEFIAEIQAADPGLTYEQAETRFRLEKSRAKAVVVKRMRNLIRRRRPIQSPEQMAA